MNVPALQLDSVGSRDADLLKACVIALAGHRSSLLPMPQWTVDQLDTGFADDHSGYDGQKNVDSACYYQQLEQLTHDHGYVLEARKFQLRKTLGEKDCRTGTLAVACFLRKDAFRKGK
jgi:hypothetical protein